MKNPRRSFLELRVGNTHSVEVLMHLRAKDQEWFHSVPEHREEFMQLLSKRIIPREFEDEILKYHGRSKGGGAEKAVAVGEKNIAKKVAKTAGPKNGKGSKEGGKRKRAPALQREPSERPRRDVTHVFGDNIQLTYRLVDINAHHGATISITKGDKKGQLEFHHYPKLPKRIVVWVFRFSGDVTEATPDDGGFPRPERIPITSLFRQAEEF